MMSLVTQAGISDFRGTCVYCHEYRPVYEDQFYQGFTKHKLGTLTVTQLIREDNEVPLRTTQDTNNQGGTYSTVTQLRSGQVACLVFRRL